MINQHSINQSSTNFNLEERTVKLAVSIIDLLKPLKITAKNRRIIDQLIGSGGSIGANYCEATEAESKRDFQHKLGICKKEIKETKYWLRLLACTHPEYKPQIRQLYKESQELLLIFSQSIKTSKGNK